ncbi:MAG: dTDP-4-dehydrorhamnose reductase [Planctomycetaceae bacterium]|nr:dTDP-4-dehydrorhamnose reductase [Planctomycetaceae bacterium]
MRIALVGSDGQLAWDLARSLMAVDDFTLIPLGRSQIDVTRQESVDAALDAAMPDWVINTAAYNAVDRAEDEPDAAFAVNALGPRNLARWCARSKTVAGRADVRLVHFSTDHVFTGSDSLNSLPWTETDLPSPPSVYANTKLAGEKFIEAEWPAHFILRTCGLYGMKPTAVKGNFVQTMLRIGKERAATGQPLTVVNDHRCTPTSTADLANAVADLIRAIERSGPKGAGLHGIYHATNSGSATWFEFAQQIFELVQYPVLVQPTTNAAMGVKARRPKFSVINCDKLHRLIGRPLPTWQDALRRYLKELQLVPPAP